MREEPWRPDHPSVISAASMSALLGVPTDVPLDPVTMAHHLRVTFFPHVRRTPRLEQFVHRFEEALRHAGVTVVPYADALLPGPRPRLKERLVVIAAGELESGNLPVDHVSNLRTTTVIGILDRPFPVGHGGGLQEKLNNVIRELAWSITQVLLFVEEDRWTVCTMNGAIIPFPMGERFEGDVRSTVIPKLAAPVVPPHSTDFAFEEGTLDLHGEEYAPYVDDFVTAAPLWERTGLMLFHTSLDRLEFRSPFYRRIAAAYLDRRSGMSYGFLARQRAVPPLRVLQGAEADHLFGGRAWRDAGVTLEGDRSWVALHLSSGEVAVEVPPVHVLVTRSGCDKAHLDGHRDLMLATLRNGAIAFRTPGGGLDYRPSYDTRTIMAHALGNALATGLLQGTTSSFRDALHSGGMALAHWHGEVDPTLLHPDMVLYGEQNPPVSCSTHQAAVFALRGKLEAVRHCIETGKPFVADVHVEPCHGINVGWPTLTGLARLLLDSEGESPHTAAIEGGKPAVAAQPPVQR